MSEGSRHERPVATTDPVVALRFGVVGDPIAHSKSPLVHEAAYRALGLPHRYERIHTPASALPDVIARVRSGELAGVNVTIPHKTSVMGLVDLCAPSAALAGAANTIVRSAEGRLTAHNTDAPALAEELRALAARDLRGTSALVIGTGGAARGAVVALLELGVATIAVRGRRLADPEAARAFASELVALGARAGASARFEVGSLEGAADDARFAAVVQATSAGMSGADAGDGVASAVSFADLAKDAVAIDLVYVPRSTPFLRAAQARHVRNDHGIGMLVRQAALAFELWIGEKPPLGAMRAALDP